MNDDDLTRARNALIRSLKVYEILHLHYMRNSRTAYAPKHGGRPKEYRQWVLRTPEYEDRFCGTKVCVKLRLNT